MTAFNTPIITPLFRIVAVLLLKLTGWKTAGTPPTFRKYVMIAAPHTSNWDFFYTMVIGFSMNLKICWMGKDSLFKGPAGLFFRWMGGIPIDRTRSNNVVAESVEAFRRARSLIMVIPPEGTRAKTRYWKTGFYHIANSAGVPIVMGFLDFRLKTGGIGPAIVPTGEIKTDMQMIESFYRNVTGKYPDLTSNVDVPADKTRFVDFRPIISRTNSILSPTGNVDSDSLMLRAYYRYLVQQAGQMQPAA